MCGVTELSIFPLLLIFSQLDKRILTSQSKVSFWNHLSNMKSISELLTGKRGDFTTGQSWGALRKAWKGYRIAKVQSEDAKMREYARKIRKFQTELGVSVASFPQLDII